MLKRGVLDVDVDCRYCAGEKEVTGLFSDTSAIASYLLIARLIEVIVSLNNKIKKNGFPFLLVKPQSKSKLRTGSKHDRMISMAISPISYVLYFSRDLMSFSMVFFLFL